MIYANLRKPHFNDYMDNFLMLSVGDKNGFVIRDFSISGEDITNACSRSISVEDGDFECIFTVVPNTGISIGEISFDLAKAFRKLGVEVFFSDIIFKDLFGKPTLLYDTYYYKYIKVSDGSEGILVDYRPRIDASCSQNFCECNTYFETLGWYEENGYYRLSDSYNLNQDEIIKKFLKDFKVLGVAWKQM